MNRVELALSHTNFIAAGPGCGTARQWDLHAVAIWVGGVREQVGLLIGRQLRWRCLKRLLNWDLLQRVSIIELDRASLIRWELFTKVAQELLICERGRYTSLRLGLWLLHATLFFCEHVAVQLMQLFQLQRLIA